MESPIPKMATQSTDQVFTSQIPDLFIRVKIRRGFLKKEWVDVKSYLLDKTHCLIKTDEIFPLNEKIVLSLRLKLEPIDLVIDSINATVLKKKKECSCFFYNLEFDENSLKAPPATESPLVRLETLIKRKQLINKKVLDLSQSPA
jgi:hypothetical protein